MTREKTLVPPFLRGARGDLGLIVKQPFLTGFDVKLTPMGTVRCPYGDLIDFFLLIAQLPMWINSSFVQLALNLFPNLTVEK